MGHAFITYGERHVLLHDWDIWAVRHFLICEAADVSSNDLGIDEPTLQLLRIHIENWRWLGPGVVTGTELADYVKHDSVRANSLAILFQRTTTRLAAFKGTIPLDYLKQHLSNDGSILFTEAVDTKSLMNALHALGDLVRAPC